MNVTEGFAPRFDSSKDDTALLRRICKAYVRSTSHPDSSRMCYQPTEWWNGIRSSCLGPVMRALRECDITSLRTMYANFFRDRCATGLIGVPYGMAKAYFQGPLRDVHRHCYMGQALYRLDYWLSQTGGRFGLDVLAGPKVGNPFGVLIDGALVPYDSEYQHYCAHQILNLVSARPSVVGEIGSGYGGMAYYLLRDGKQHTYIGFDVPESIALTSYYLLKSFPSARFLLYGEKELNAETIAASDIVLLPLFQMDAIQPETLDLMFSSHVMADLSSDAVAEYLRVIRRMTKDYFLYSGNTVTGEQLSGLADGGFKLLTARCTEWNQYKAPDAREGEYLFRIVH